MQANGRWDLIRRLKVNMVASSRNHFCRAKAKLVTTNTECLSVALVTQHAKRMRHIAIRGLSRSTTFSHISQTARFFRKKNMLLKIKCAL